MSIHNTEEHYSSYHEINLANIKQRLVNADSENPDRTPHHLDCLVNLDLEKIFRASNNGNILIEVRDEGLHDLVGEWSIPSNEIYCLDVDQSDPYPVQAWRLLMLKYSQTEKLLVNSDYII